jgi:hypothetical protein
MNVIFQVAELRSMKEWLQHTINAKSRKLSMLSKVRVTWIRSAYGLSRYRVRQLEIGRRSDDLFNCLADLGYIYE